MLSEFKKFAMRGNVIDMAVGVILGASFGAIVTSLVDDVLMPPLGMLLGSVDFSDLYINLSGGTYASLAEAQEAGAVTLRYGSFLTTIIDFTLIAFVIFLIVRQLNRWNLTEDKETKECKECLSEIPAAATRCAFCTKPARK